VGRKQVPALRENVNGPVSDMQATGTQLPKLPKLDDEDVKAVRSFLPGKLLSRTAALLALAVLLLSVAGSLDQGLKRLLDVDLSSTPWVRFTLLFGLPLLAVASQMIIEWRAEHGRRTLQRLAVQTGVEQSDYFLIGPYMNTAHDRAKFRRADRAHEKVLSWIEGSANVPLYLTGDSGSGKSSLLNAFVFPTLRDHGYIVIEARAGHDPETALRHALLPFLGAQCYQQSSPDLHQLLATAVRATSTHLLVVLDQFEEFLILGQREQQHKFATLIANLKTAPIQSLSILLVLRSDYQTLLDDVGLPPLLHGDNNYYQVGRFNIAAAGDFIARSGLNLDPRTLDRLLSSAAELDDTPGLVRPITVNVIGYVLATGKAVAMSADAGQLIRHYIEVTVGQPAIRDFAPRILRELVTEQGTKLPRSEQQLAVSTNLRRGEVRAVLNGLGDANLARLLDPVESVWELSHDFIARAVMRFLGRHRRDLLRQTAGYAAPALLAATLLIGGGLIAWDRLSPDQTRAELAELGLKIIPIPNGSGIVRIEHTPELFSKSGGLFEKIDQRYLLRSINLNYMPEVIDLVPLRNLKSVDHLNISATNVRDLKPLKSLIALQHLDISRTPVDDLTPLKGIPSLQVIDLSQSKVNDLSPLLELPNLRIVGVYNPAIERSPAGQALMRKGVSIPP
jgi:hypothetical protein